MKRTSTSSSSADLTRLDEANWDEIYPKALFWAEKWYKANLSGVPSPWEPRDLVQEAIDALYSGRRRLAPDVSLLTILVKIMHSMASNLKRKKEQNRVTFEEKKGEGVASIEAMQLCEEARRIVKEDDLAEKIVALLCKDAGLKAKDLAAELGLEVKDIYNGLKRMRRLLKEHLKETT